MRWLFRILRMALLVALLNPSPGNAAATHVYGYVGGSPTHNTIEGYHMVSTEHRFWPQITAYAAKTTDVWADPTSREGQAAWRAFDDAVATHGVPQMVWFQITDQEETPYEAVVTVVGLIEDRLPGVPIYLSPSYALTFPSPHPWRSTVDHANRGAGNVAYGVGGDGLAYRALGRKLDSDYPQGHPDLAIPELGPLTEETTKNGDKGGGHPNEEGKVLLGGQMVEFFDGDFVPGQAPPAGDTTAPEVACASADGAWHADNVAIGCTASDPGSGLADPSDATFSLVTTVPAGAEDPDAATGSRQVCDNAGNCATAGPVPGNKVDRKAPAISVASPAAGTHVLNEAVPAAYSCSDGGSGVASCLGPVPNGAGADTATVGTKQFSVDAADATGNLGSAAVTYTVAYDVALLYDPARATRTIKVRLQDAAGLNVSSRAVILTVQSIDGSKPASGKFSFNSSQGAYSYRVDITGLAPGPHTLEFVAGSDPSVHSVPFTVR